MSGWRAGGQKPASVRRGVVATRNQAAEVNVADYSGDRSFGFQSHPKQQKKYSETKHFAVNFSKGSFKAVFFGDPPYNNYSLLYFG